MFNTAQKKRGKLQKVLECGKESKHMQCVVFRRTGSELKRVKKGCKKAFSMSIQRIMQGEALDEDMLFVESQQRSTRAGNRH